MAKAKEYTVYAKVEVEVHKTVMAANKMSAKRIATQHVDGWWYPDDSATPNYGQVTRVEEN